ncbi:MAG: HI1506-related protein [Rhizomicrobium sp.]
MAKKDAPKIELPEKGQLVRIKAHRDGYRRAGVAHTKAGADHAHDTFTPAQLEALHGDANLSVSYVDAPKTPGPQTSNKPSDKS